MIALDNERIEKWFRGYKQVPRSMGEFYTISTSVDRADGEKENLKASFERSEEPIIVDSACFGRFLSYLSTSKKVLNQKSKELYVKSSATITIRIELSRANTWNALWMNPDQFNAYLGYLKEHVRLPFDWELTTNHIKVTFHYSDLKSRNQVKMVLFWIRQAYKYPCSLFTYDAIQLWNRHPEEELYNFLSVPILAVRAYGDFYGSQINFPDRSKLVRLESLQENLSHSAGANLSQGWGKRYEKYIALNNFFVGVNWTKCIKKMPTDIIPSHAGFLLWGSGTWLPYRQPSDANGWLNVENRLDKLEEAYQYKLEQGYID